MITDNSKHTSTIYYSRNVPHLSMDTYDYNTANKFRPWYSKNKFKTLVIDISQDEKDLLSSYQYRVRRYVRKASEMRLEYNIHRSGEDFYDLQKSIVQFNPNVTYYPYSLLTPRPHRLFTTIKTSKFGILSMHGHLLDPENSQCLLSMNISRYREFQDSKVRQLAGMANTFLFHRDFMHFNKMGFTKYDMGGFEIDTLKQFKKGFGGNVVHYYRYKPLLSSFIRKIKNKIQ
ncbi:hypothetical protein [Membranihabitans maritimus]|uniref:hypothetical protein n=1 Tax=Membranihabitans maritimus TaxID=2904244 RepID=UPI001F48490A|nr:hypothetical protein [Membranihabitans maritimus]